MFKITFSYPDGHVEEIDQVFNTLEDAKDYGFNLLNQVGATEIHKGKTYKDAFGGNEGEAQPAFFIVSKYEGGKVKRVFISLR